MSRMYIDDVRTPKTDNWVIVRGYLEATTWMRETGCPEYISFDHDLGTFLSGYDIVKWMIETDLDHRGTWIPENFDFHVHSANPVGAKNIMSLLGAYLRHRKIKP